MFNRNKNVSSVDELEEQAPADKFFEENDYESAYPLYKKLVDLDPSNKNLYRYDYCAYFYANDKKVGMKYMEDAAKRGYGPALHQLGMLSYTKRDYKVGTKYLLKAAKGGYAPSYTQLGMFSYSNKDYKKAISYLEKASKMGDDKAIDLLISAKRDFIVAKADKLDYQKALPLYLKVVSDGDSYVNYSIGLCYKNAKKDRSKCVSYLEKAAYFGNADAQFELAEYYSGDICAFKLGYGSLYTQVFDNAEAFKWYMEAAKQDHLLATIALGICYEEGLGVKKSYKDAIYWYEKAAPRGGKAWYAEDRLKILK